MAKTEKRPLWITLFVGLILLPFFAIYGAFALLLGAKNVGRWFRGLAAGLGSTIYCRLGHANPTRGRFVCSSCHAEYLGFIGRCSICGAGAGWTPCVRCRTAMRLPWERS